jgi:hypothetical protein
MARVHHDLGGAGFAGPASKKNHRRRRCSQSLLAEQALLAMAKTLAMAKALAMAKGSLRA